MSKTIGRTNDILVEERDLSKVVVPRQPSNRSVYEQMLKWGWTEGNTDGKWLSMYGPPIGQMDGVRVRIRPATQHDANPTTVFRDIYRLTTNGDPRLFWAGPGEMYEQILDMARAEKAAHQRRVEEEKIAKAAARAERQRLEDEARRQREAVRVTAVVPDPVMPDPVTSEPEKEPMSNRVKIEGFPASKDVLSALSELDKPITVRDLLKHFNLPTDTPHTNAMSGRCCYLVDKGLAERVMYGTYRVAQSAGAISARVQHQVDRPPSQTQPAATVAPAPPSSPDAAGGAVEPPTVSHAVMVESIDDTIEAVLDLLLPDGFRAGHLRFIAPWVEATKRMVQEVTRG